ncbi:EamA family transporter [Rhodococcus sp. SMB37]|uniref:EamA family transporter n=1 Tax=Rhodococcus sp. SMB37 TaxID=2512213 RepID=UPI001053CCF6|nr:EamA family transporter [Rhodococcus sp. SMB37]
MTARARLLALTVVLLWGCNFLAIRVGIDHFPPIFFAGLRFLVIAVPVVLFVPRPKVELRWLLLYGLPFGFAQFGFLFWAMNAGLATGLASLVLQSSAPMTVALGALLLGERLGRIQIIGLLVAVAGMLIVAVAQGGSSIGLVPLLLGLLAGLSWAIANIATRKAKSTEPMKLMSWMCVIATAPLFAVSWIVEGPTTGWAALGSAFSTGDGRIALVGLAYTAIAGTIVGTGIYVALLGRYPAGTVAPLSLMVPIVGFTVAWAALGEVPTPLTLAGGVAVIAGALVAQSAGRRAASAARPLRRLRGRGVVRATPGAEETCRCGASLDVPAPPG